MMAQRIACPCGGHTVTLTPDMPPMGSRAAFTCPACGERRTFVRTSDGALFDTPETAPVPSATQPTAPSVMPPFASPAAPLQHFDPTPVAPGAAVVMTALDDPEWLAGIAAAFPAPDWFILAADPDPGQCVADARAHAPRVVVAANQPSALLTELAGWSGRRRERLFLIILDDCADDDPAAAFAHSADAVLDARRTDAVAERLTELLARHADLPSLFVET
ncbi:MAG: hypothetical protein AB9872_09625 [Solidesulfovibrio sp.]